VATIALHPFSRSVFREVEGRVGMIRMYWLVFDEPQIDAEGDGPYIEAEIAAEYLDAP
jgi:hypothetical protein